MVVCLAIALLGQPETFLFKMADIFGTTCLDQHTMLSCALLNDLFTQIPK